MKFPYIILICSLSLTLSCQQKPGETTKASDTTSTQNQQVNLPEPYATKSSVKFSKVIGWKDGINPKAPDGFSVTRFAENLSNPRWIYIMPNGDVLIAETRKSKSTKDKLIGKVTGKSKSEGESDGPDRILLFRDDDNDGKYDQKHTFIAGLTMPFGMLVLNDHFYVATSNALYRYPYKKGQTSISGSPQLILELPAGGYNNHWTRNIIANKDGSKIYISVGSASNVGEHGMDKEKRRACIIEINHDGSQERIYASGLRNPVGMDWAPGTNTLWTVVNERDELGDELVPDYLTSVKEGGFYGWPYSYFGKNLDPRLKDEQKPELVEKAIIPEVALGSHTASLGLAFNQGRMFPESYQNGAFIGQHGSWNRSEFSGYKVVYVPFKNGKPSGEQQDFLTGFIVEEESSEVYGRPVGAAFMKDGSLLVADDAGNTIFRISYNQQ